MLGLEAWARARMLGVLEKKADRAFQGIGAHKRSSKVQSEYDRVECKMQNIDISLHDTGMPLQSQRMELYQANELSDRV